jgi:hypothetical protein
MSPEAWRRGFRALMMEQWHSRQEKVVGLAGAAWQGGKDRVNTEA